MWFLLGINVGVFCCILVQANFKLRRFLDIGKEFVDKLEGG